MSFDRVPGQERAKSQIAAWLEAGRLPHTILVTGREGVGKRSLAMELAKVINCRAGGVEPCDTCSSCIKVDSLSHPDVHILLPLTVGRRSRQVSDETAEASARSDAEEAARLREATLAYLQQHISLGRTGTNIAREHIRLLQREMAYAPSESRRRIGLVFDADCMHRAGANSLLKILEEPPAHAVLVLVSASPDRLLATVLSRCQRLHLRPLTRAETMAQARNRGADEERAQLAARTAMGSLLGSEEVVAEGFETVRTQTERFLEAGFEGRDQVYWELMKEFGARPDREDLERFLSVCGTYLRDLFLLAHGRPEDLVNADRAEMLGAWLGQVRMDRVEGAALQIDESYAHLFQNVNPQLLLAELWRRVNACRRQASGQV